MLAKWLTSKWQFWAAGALSLKSYDSTLGVHSVLVCFGPLKWSIRRFYQKLVWGGKRKEEKFGRQYSPEDAKPCAHARQTHCENTLSNYMHVTERFSIFSLICRQSVLSQDHHRIFSINITTENRTQCTPSPTLDQAAPTNKSRWFLCVRMHWYMRCCEN